MSKSPLKRAGKEDELDRKWKDRENRRQHEPLTMSWDVRSLGLEVRMGTVNMWTLHLLPALGTMPEVPPSSFSPAFSFPTFWT